MPHAVGPWATSRFGHLHHICTPTTSLLPTSYPAHISSALAVATAAHHRHSHCSSHHHHCRQSHHCPPHLTHTPTLLPLPTYLLAYATAAHLCECYHCRCHHRHHPCCVMWPLSCMYINCCACATDQLSTHLPHFSPASPSLHTTSALNCLSSCLPPVLLASHTLHITHPCGKTVRHVPSTSHIHVGRQCITHPPHHLSATD